MLGLLFTLPAPNELLSAVGSTSEPVFGEFLPVAELAIGFLFGVFAIVFIVMLIAKVVRDHSHAPSK